jgi:hypothetical protein
MQSDLKNEVSSLCESNEGGVDVFMSSPWIYWGVGPSFGAMIGFVATSLLCEWLVTQQWARCWLLVYSDSGDRIKDIAETQSNVSWWKQTKNSLWHVAGPSNLVAVVALRFFSSSAC